MSFEETETVVFSKVTVSFYIPASKVWKTSLSMIGIVSHLAILVGVRQYHSVRDLGPQQ